MLQSEQPWFLLRQAREKEAEIEEAILVSNRLPVTIRSTSGGRQELTPSSGGLVAGLRPVHESGGLWVGHPGEEPDKATRVHLGDRRLVPVPVSQSEHRSYYLGYSNSAIWPLFHYLIEQCAFRAEDFKAYQRVNERFADVVAWHAKPDSIIWVHDYQLMLLPGLLRDRLPDARIGFFLHIPFPSSEVLRILPQREEILRGLLGADLIGLHTYDYAQNLIFSLRRTLGLEAREGVLKSEGRRVRIEAHPLGIDAKGMLSAAFSKAADRRLRTLKSVMRGRKVILGVDRLDYTKGLTLKLAAFRHFLSKCPKWRDKVVLIQIAVPSRSGIEAYRKQKDEVERLVGEINGMYGAPERFLPVHYLYRSVSPEELGALYRLADVALITPVRDGLNLVAKEYVACHEGDSALVLSEFAGAASELGEALRVNPWDVEGTAEALEHALDMAPADRQERMAAMRRRVIASDVQLWGERFMQSLTAPGAPTPATPPMLSPDVLAEAIGPEFAIARNALLALDYDGTLREFTPRYEDATPTKDVLALLGELSRLPAAHVLIVSGRQKDTLEAWFGGLPVSLIAEHGAWLRYRGAAQWQAIAEKGDTAWKDQARRVMEDYVVRTSGARIEEKSSSIAWHFSEVPADIGEWQAREIAALLESLLAQSPAEVVLGARTVEVRQHGLDKGHAYDAVVKEHGPFDFVLATGDDHTDEDLFARLGETEFSVRVGAGASRGHVAVDSPAALRRLLTALVEMRAAA